MKIGIIGAGAAGLAALRHALSQGHECVSFEQTGQIGGTWNYTDCIDTDEHGLSIHSSMYQGLKTNLPKELMEYEEFYYQGVDESFVDHEAVVEYMKQFAAHYNLYPHIKFFRHIIQVKPLANQRWELKERNLKTNEVTEHRFDAIMICIGNYSVPKMPEIPGMNGLKDKAIHSHYYRTPDLYKGKKVLIIGAGPSGIDIARIVSEVAEKVVISYGSTFFFETPSNVRHKPLVRQFEENRALFDDETEEEIDNVIYCTGYQYCYPFLTPECGIKVENNWVKYLYKHIVNVEHPTMGFIGITFKVCPFPTFDIQIRFFLEFIKDTSVIPRDEMVTDILRNIREKGLPLHHVHKIGMPCHKDYFDDLANTVQIKKVKPVLHKLYEHLSNNRNIKKRYKIISDEDFIELN